MSPTGNCDIDFLILRHRFHIMSLKFQKFERVQNDAEKFQIMKKRKCEITNLNESEIYASESA
jgi:hypothetical protein